MKLSAVVLAMAAASAIAGCAPFAHELNKLNANKHVMAAKQASQNQDWVEARRQWGLALMNVRLAQANANDEALVLYEYGRVLGVTCDYSNAKQALQASLALSRQTGHQVYLPLLELALLAEHQHDTQAALKYYQELVPEIESSRVALEHPYGVAHVYRRYAKLLAATGNASGAAHMREKEKAVTGDNPDVPEEMPLTGYGRACIKPGDAKNA
jgi:tetratricopeptide (TPR) repeat protein